MSDAKNCDITVNCDPSNPGQFYACCGLLELADRCWNGAEGWFDTTYFHFSVRPKSGSQTAGGLLAQIAAMSISNTMSQEQIEQLAILKSKGGKMTSTREKAEKKLLESLWRSSPIEIDTPTLHINWFHDTRSGGSRFKTWAGQQSVIDIARSMHRPIAQNEYNDVAVEDWLQFSFGDDLSFNFDSDASAQIAALDVGFSLDPLGMSSSTKPLTELLAFIGLQRFRPSYVSGESSYSYGLWTIPLDPAAAFLAASTAVLPVVAQQYSFPLLYRTKYLKSFLPAKPIGI